MLLALLLVGHAAAEWVEISQQHYRKPVRITTTLDTTRNNYPDVHQDPTKTTYQDVQTPARNEDHTRNTHLDVLQTSTRDSYLQNMQNPARKYQDDLLSVKNSYPHHEVSLRKPIREQFLNNSEPFPRPVRFNPFLQEDTFAQSPFQNTKVDKVSNPTRDTYFNKKIENTMEDTYLNRSITEHSWDQNIRREDAKFVTTVTHFDNWDDNTQEKNDKPYKKSQLKVDNNGRNTARIQDDTVSGKIERVPSLGNVKRVQIQNTPVKSPALNNKAPKNTNRRKDQHSYGAHNYDSFNDELDLETSIFNSDEGSVSQKPSNNFKQESSETEQINHEGSENPKSPLTSLQRHPFTHNLDDVTDKVTKVMQGNAKFTQNGVSKNAESAGHNDMNQSIAPNKGPVQLGGAIEESLEEFTGNEGVLSKSVTNKKTVETNMETGESGNSNRGSVKVEEIDHAGDESSSEKKENINKSSSEIKVNTIENLLKFLKVVSDTISKNTRRGKSKITYLNELKRTLMANIKNRIDAIWPDETTAGTRRLSRSATARGHVEFPSSESALMTISFLTFAVFLIKLVLQVIQTYKHKAMVMAPVMLATAGRAVSKRLREN